MSLVLGAPNLNHLWARLMVEELLRCGVYCFVISPGSRSTPLAWAVAEHASARSYVHFDERGAAFFALGAAKASNAPAVLVCTSGSAGANYFPAIIEAAQTGIPLIILTADRPPELLHAGANQAIDQTRMFGGYARWSVEMPPPEVSIPPEYVLTTVDHAVRESEHPRPGPVHVNCAYREPLAPTEQEVDLAAYCNHLRDWASVRAPYTVGLRGKPALTESQFATVISALDESSKALITVGAMPLVRQMHVSSLLSEGLPWPILADAATGFRAGRWNASVITHFDQLLLSEEFREAQRPDLVVHIGGPMTSKRLSQWVASSGCVRMHVTQEGRRIDPEHLGGLHLQVDEASFCEALAARYAGAAAGAQLRAWQAADAAAGAAIDAFLSAQPGITEMAVARIVSRTRPVDGIVFVGNSMPIRDYDMYGASMEQAGFTASNRGASGIDGNIATAAGCALLSASSTTVIVGDLTALHDLNSLALLRHAEAPVVVIVINNDGGGIFHFLPVATHGRHFEALFGTAHGLVFEDAARMFGLDYSAPSTPTAFESAYRAAQASNNHTLIEVRTDRAENAALHRALQQRVEAALAGVHEA